MNDHTISPEQVQKIYTRRFAHNHASRKMIYAVLCRDFFQKYIPEDSTVIEIAAGYCEFINAIRANRKIAVDLNPAVSEKAAPGVEVIISSATDLRPSVPDNSVDAAFCGNFLEHLPRPQIVEVIRELHRVLRPTGKLLILGPNYRYCSRDYFMFFDHQTALDHRSVIEVLEVNQFQIKECRPKFLPYTMVSAFPNSEFLFKQYLKSPILQAIFGQQFFIQAQKSK